MITVSDDLQLDPSTTALLVLDLQNSMRGRDPGPYSLDEVVKRSRSLVDAFRANGALPVFVHVLLHEFLTLPTDAPRQVPPNIPESASDVLPAVGIQPGDLLIGKRHWGAFGTTTLHSELRTRGIQTLVLTGIATNLAVEGTAREAAALGFHVVVVEDACTSFNREMHEFSITKILPRLSRVRSSQQVLAAIGN